MFLIPGRCNVGLLGTLLILAWGVSAANDAAPDVAESPSWQAAAPIAGFKPLYGVQPQPVTLDARDSTCSSNGSNFCFGDNVNFCASCGTCCGSSSSGYCCGADQVCCGTACCASGQTCSNGECFLSLATVTVTSATEVTVSHLATETVTVQQNVVSTSTIFSTTQVTVTSGGGTETDVVYVTVTASAAKRAVVVDVLEPRQATSQDGIWETFQLFYKRFSFPWTDTPSRSTQLRRRDLRATQSPLTGISSSTVITTSVTLTSDVTSFVSVTTTVPTSSIALTTVLETKTIVAGATTTITTTSTITVTPNAPITETVTKTATTTPPLSSSTNSAPSSASSSAAASSSSSGSSSSSQLSKGAVAGIAGGIGGAAFLALVVGLLWWFRRRRNRGPAHQDPSSYLEPYIPDMSSPIPGPRGGTSPSLNRFSAAAPHHADGVAGAGAGAGAVGGVKNLNRYSNISGGPGRKSLSPRMPPAAAEPSGGQVYEIDGTTRAPPHEIYEADGGQQPYASYPADAAEMEDSSPISPVAGRGHTRNASSGSSRYGSQAGDHLMGLSPVSEMGEGADRARHTDPYRTPGTYRDF